MKLDTQASIELSKIIAKYLLQDITTLLEYLAGGTLIGILLVYVLYRIIKVKGWFKRNPESRLWKFLYFTLRSTFYLGILGVCSTVGLIIGSNKIVEKEVNTLVDEGIAYFQATYFDDFEFVEGVFELTELVYSSGYEVNDFNEQVAEVMADEVAKKYGLGFLGSYLLAGPKNEISTFLEDTERGMLMLAVGYGLEQIGAEELMDEEQLDKTFYAWLHSDEDASLGSMNGFLSTQICSQIKPLLLGIWLPFLLIPLFFILLNSVELVVYFSKKKGTHPQDKETEILV